MKMKKNQTKRNETRIKLLLDWFLFLLLFFICLFFSLLFVVVVVTFWFSHTFIFDFVALRFYGFYFDSADELMSCSSSDAAAHAQSNTTKAATSTHTHEHLRTQRCNTKTKTRRTRTTTACGAAQIRTERNERLKRTELSRSHCCCCWRCC